MKMATFENYYVNFFNETDCVFQEGKGPVERSDIENINISEIIENRDFKLLEKNLVHVRNFNFEKGYNVKNLDDNLFKLFRLAQIGLNYLMHKESCLSKCLLLLQEEVETLQRERESSKRLSNLNVQRVKNRKTIVEPHYQCQECGKIFITESYLKCHEKRRHKNPLNVKVEEENSKRSTYTQTLSERKVAEKESKSHLMIQKLEKELEELKDRLNATETCLKEKEKEKEPPQCSPAPQVFFPSTVVRSVFPAGPEPDPFESPSHSLPHQNHHAKIIMDSLDKNEEKLTECFSKSGAGNDQRNDDKENMKPSSVSIPKPFPRRIKEKKETDFGAESIHGANAAKEIKNCLSPEKNRYEYSTGERRKEVETVETITKETTWGFESCEEKGSLGVSKSASLLKKLVKKSSPRILELKYNLKKSLTNLYESVTSVGKENPKGNGNESEAGQPGTTETANSRQIKEISDTSKKKILTTEPGSERKMEKGIERWQGGNLKDYQEPRSLKENGGNSVMYSYGTQIESDPESDSPSVKENEIKEKTQLTMRKEEKEFDLTIFQVGKFKNNFNKFNNE